MGGPGECQLKAIISSLPKLLDSSGNSKDYTLRNIFWELIEYDVPSKLLETNSAFSKLVSEYSSLQEKLHAQS
ncbi:hypothetical protein Q3G72_015102 [Acer saccharum]|nr:hypothetical protein Q3G72_015102 [Acer saccharum]